MNEHVYFICVGEDGTEITITPKNYWDKNHCVSDEEEDENVNQFLENQGFERVCDSTYVSEDVSLEDIQKILENNDMFVLDTSFIDFLKD